MQTQLAWLAGVIDGEGSISLLKTSGRRTKCGICPIVTITNTNDMLVFHAMSILDSVGVEYKVRRFKGGKLFAGRLEVGKRESVKILLEVVTEHLVAKRAQAILLLEYLDTTVYRKHSPELKEEFRQRMSTINHSNPGFSVETIHRASRQASEELVRPVQECTESDGNDRSRVN